MRQTRSVRWRLDERVAWQSVGGEVVVMDLASGKAIGLNATGSFIWTRLADRDDVEIANELAERFRIEPERAAVDMKGFLSEMESRGLLRPGSDQS